MTQEKMYIWTEDTKSGYSFWLNFFNRLVPEAIGPCWINNCCEWQERAAEDICGLDNIRISSKEKMHQIFTDSVDLVNGFQAAGIGVKSDNNL